MDFFNQAHINLSNEYSTRQPFRRQEVTAIASLLAPTAIGDLLEHARVLPGCKVMVEEYHDVVFMGHIIERGIQEVPSGGWVRVTQRRKSARSESSLAYVTAIYSIGHRFFLALDIYPASALDEDAETGELTSVHAGVTSNPHLPGGVGVQCSIVEATEQETHVAVLTKLVNNRTLTQLGGQAMCRFVPKAGA